MAEISDTVNERRRFDNCFQNLRSKDLSWKQRGGFLFEWLKNLHLKQIIELYTESGLGLQAFFLVIRRLLHDTHAIVARQCGRIVGRRCFSGAFGGRVMVRVAVGVRTAVRGALARQKAET